MSEFEDTAKTVGIGVIGIALIAVVLSAVFGMVFAFAGGGAILEPAPQQFVEVDSGDELPAGFSVDASTGNSLGLYGDAYADIPNNIAENGSWTFAATAEPMGNPDATYVLYGEQNETLLILKEAGQWTARYEVNGDTAFVSAPATEDRQTVGVTWADTAGELRLYVDGEMRDTASPTATSAPRSVAINWDGTIDEVRGWSAALGNATHSDYHADAVQPIQTSDATLRLMFNDGQQQTAYYVDGDAEIVGGSSVNDGVEPPALVEGEDYEVRTSPVEVRATDTGYVSDAPVILVSWPASTFANLAENLAATGASALGLLVIGLFVLAARAVLDEFGGGF